MQLANGFNLATVELMMDYQPNGLQYQAECRADNK